MDLCKPPVKTHLCFIISSVRWERIAALSQMRLSVRELKTPADEDAWNNGNVDAIAQAHTVLTCRAANYVVWFGLNWNYELYVQANKRLHRQG